MTELTTSFYGGSRVCRLFLAAVCLATLTLTGAVLGPNTALATNLPPEILKDKYEIVLGRHLATHSYDRAARYMERLAALRAEFGIELDEGFEYQRAEVHYQLRHYEQAAAYLTDYLAAAGKQGVYYDKALSLLVDAETAAEDVSIQREAAQNRRQTLKKAQQTTNQVTRQAASQQALMEQAARQATIDQMARQRQAQIEAEKPKGPAPIDTRLLERQKSLARQFSQLINNFRYDAEAQAVDGNPGRRFVFHLQANITQQAKAGPGACELSFASDGGYSVERTPLTHSGTREKRTERVAQAQVKTTIHGFNAAQLKVNNTEQLHKAFNVYTFSAGTEQKITIHGAGGYMLRLYDIATAWGKACSPPSP